MRKGRNFMNRNGERLLPNKINGNIGKRERMKKELTPL